MFTAEAIVRRRDDSVMFTVIASGMTPANAKRMAEKSAFQRLADSASLYRQAARVDAELI